MKFVQRQTTSCDNNLLAKSLTILIVFDWKIDCLLVRNIHRMAVKAFKPQSFCVDVGAGGQTGGAALLDTEEPGDCLGSLSSFLLKKRLGGELGHAVGLFR